MRTRNVFTYLPRRINAESNAPSDSIKEEYQNNEFGPSLVPLGSKNTEIGICG